MVIGLDGIALVVDSGSSQTCSTTPHAARPLTNGEPNSAPTAPFSGFANSGTLAGVSPTYTIGAAGTSWRDILLILYTGYDNTMPAPNSGAAGPAGSCNSSVRQALASHYDGLYQGGCSTNACPNGIKHAYRRNDLSGTTDTFLGLIGAPKLTKAADGVTVTGTPFCNGMYTEDNDPIRRPCDPSEQVCEYDGTLGLVIPIDVPTTTNDTTVIYNGGKVPTSGRFLIAAAPTCDNGPVWIKPGVIAAPSALQNTFSTRCDCRFPVPQDFVTAHVNPDGTTNNSAQKNGQFNWNVPIGGGCQVPTTTTTPTTATWGLLNGDDGVGDNTPVAWGNQYDPGSGFLTCCTAKVNGTNTNVVMDPRAMNFAMRSPTNGHYLSQAGSTAEIQVSFHRLHTNAAGKTNVAVSGTPAALCQKVDATENIGCLVEFPTADVCSVGYAGLDASDKDFADRVALNGIDPTLTTIQALVAGGSTYPLARKLYINSLMGFENFNESTDVHTGSMTSFAAGAETSTQGQDNGEYNLAKCFYQDYTNASPSLTKVGFIQLPATGGRPAGKPFCQNACGASACGADADHTAVFDAAFGR
jgi:hypothetical protein